MSIVMRSWYECADDDMVDDINDDNDLPYGGVYDDDIDYEACIDELTQP